MARTITVDLGVGVDAYTRGHGSYELVKEIRRGRTPMRVSRGWVTRRKSIADLIALAESRGYTVVVLDASDREVGR